MTPFVTIQYAPHPKFRRDGDDLREDLAVSLEDAVLGAKVRVPTLSGAVELNVPAWTSGGAHLPPARQGHAQGRRRPWAICW